MIRATTMMIAVAIGLSGCTGAGDDAVRDHISVVGSSTVFPFTTAVAEQFVRRTPDAAAPVVESTGTGGGINLFCKGLGVRFPDVADASRRMKPDEFATCHRNGVDAIMEIQIGIDGVAFAEAVNGPKLRLTPADVFRALAAAPMHRRNTARTWHEVNSALPAVPITVYGPPATSGTRDALAELILARGCEAVMPEMARTRDTATQIFKQTCTRIRDDGAYVDAGENDNLIVQKLQANPQAVGIFGYSYLEANKDKLVGVPIDGIAPTYETIASGAYPGSRPLYLYVKALHLKAIPGLARFLDIYAESWGPDGPMIRRGLIAAPQGVRDASARIIRDRIPLDPAALGEAAAARGRPAGS